jgi:hypothetical protein
MSFSEQINTTKNMDTDELSNETYKAVLTTAARFHEDLTLQFGLLADDCRTDNEFLDKSESLINNWLLINDLNELIWHIFFENHPNEKDLKKTLIKILANIEKVRNIPIKNRHFDF